MHDSLPASLPRFFRRLVPPLLAVVCSVALRAADENRRAFDIPAGSAAQTLKQFAAQAACEIVFSPEVVAPVKTNAVQGELPPRTALEHMLADTGLVASQDQKTGAFAV